MQTFLFFGIVPEKTPRGGKKRGVEKCSPEDGHRTPCCTPRALAVCPDAMTKDVEEASAHELAEAKKATWASGLVAFTLTVVVIVLGVLVVTVATRDDKACTVHLPTDLYGAAEAPAGTHATSTSMGGIYPGASSLRHARAHNAVCVSCGLDIARVSRQRGRRLAGRNSLSAISFRRFSPRA